MRSELIETLAEISDLKRATALLAWDERTKMPSAGAAARAEQIASLTRIRHLRLTSDELGRLLDSAEGQLGSSSPLEFEASLLRRARRDWEKARRVPADLQAELARTTSLAEHAWEDARADSDFAVFLPHLERVVELKRRYIDCFEVEHPYDALLDDFEPAMTTRELTPVLERLCEGVVELLGEIDRNGHEVDSSCLYGDFALERQAVLAEMVAARLPLQPDAWRLDDTVHPFATAIAISDVRITTRFDSSYIGTALWSVIHEVGHALYHNGIDPELDRTPLCTSASLGFDESSSRLWENWVGRGRPYLTHLLALLQQSFGDHFGSVDAEQLYRAANRVERTPIRVEADEVTYNLHIALRFELERELFAGRVTVAELPEAWDALAQRLVGIEPSGAANGVLQDVHWGSGAFGYFPTYSLGNVIAGQLWELARIELPQLDEQLAAGETGPLRDFLGERVYRHGAKLLPGEMIELACGGPLDPEPLLAHLRAKFGEVYGLAGVAQG